MTANQINYWRYREELRHNQAAEGENVRHNKVSEQTAKAQINLGYSQLHETSRHNIAGEQVSWANLSEGRRHNIATETLNANSLQETARHNKVTETNQAVEIGEHIRHNKSMESISQANARLDADTKRQVAQKNYEGTKYTADRNLISNKYGTDVKAASDRYKTDTDFRSKLITTEMTNDTQRAIAMGNAVVDIGTAVIGQVGRLGQSLVGFI